MSTPFQRHRTEQDGFTLIELLVVVLIIGILASIAIPAFLSQRRGAQDTAAKSILRNAALSLESYYEEQNGTFSAADKTSMEAIEPVYVWLDASDPASNVAEAKDDEVRIVSLTATGQGHVIETRSSSGRTYRFDRDYSRSPVLIKSCTNPDSSACPSW